MLALVLGRAATMARIPAGLPAGIRVSDHISLGVSAKALPLGEVRRVLAETGRASERERDLPAHVMVYCAIALALYTTSGTREVLRCLLEGLRWLWGAGAVRVAGRLRRSLRAVPWRAPSRQGIYWARRGERARSEGRGWTSGLGCASLAWPSTSRCAATTTSGRCGKQRRRRQPSLLLDHVPGSCRQPCHP